MAQKSQYFSKRSHKFYFVGVFEHLIILEYIECKDAELYWSMTLIQSLDTFMILTCLLVGGLAEERGRHRSFAGLQLSDHH